MFLDKYWPTKTEISSCIKRDAETVSEALLMAVHRKMNFDVEKANKLNLKDEQELLNAFLDTADGGTLVLPIMGASGVGKSHVIRWLHANLKQSENKDSLHIIRIPKTASLKQVVDYILEPLSGDENYASIRADLDTAVDVGNQQASIIRFMAELENVLEEHAVKLQAEEQKTTDRDEKKRLRTLIGFTRQIPFLMTDPAVKEHFVKTALNRITKRAHSGSQDEDDADQYDNQQQFRVDDFRLPNSVRITQAAAAVQTFYNNIDGLGNDSVRQKIVDFLNSDQLIDKAIRNTYNLNKTLGGKSIPDLILQIRKKLLGDGKELVLLIEDMAALAGFQETLLNIAIQQDTDQDGNSVRCIMRTAIAVTDGYQMADTIATRAQQKWIIKARVVTDDAALLNDITDMVGAYLNAARWGESELKVRYSKSGSLTDWLDTFKDDGISEAENNYLATFGYSQSGYALFPFNKMAINRLVRHHMVDDAGRITFRPRELIEHVLKNILNRRSSFEKDEFPRDLGLAESGVIARYVGALSYSNIEQDKARSLLSVWGDDLQTHDDIKEFPKAVFECFGLKPPKEIVGTGVGRSKPIVPPKKPDPQPIIDPDPPTPRANDKYLKVSVELDDWVQGTYLSPATANTLRKAIAKTVDNFIPWWNLDVPKPQNELTHLAYKIDSARGDDGFTPIRLEVCTSNKDPYGTVRGAFLSIYRHHTNNYTWDYPQGESDYISSIELIERLSKERVDFQRKTNLTEIKILAEALTFQSRVLGFDPPIGTKPFGSYLKSLLETGDPKPFSNEISQEWGELRSNILRKNQTGSNWREKLQEELTKKSACFRGDEGQVLAIDIIRIKKAVSTFTDKKPGQILPSFGEYFQLAPERAFRTNAKNLATTLREQSNKINHLIGGLDHFKKDKFLLDFEDFIEKLIDTGQYPKDEQLPSWNIIRDLVASMHKTALTETLNKISIILKIDFDEDQDGLSKGLNALGSLQYDQVAVITKFFEVADVLVTSSSEKITSWLANASLIDAEQSKNDLLQKLKYIGELS